MAVDYNTADGTTSYFQNVQVVLSRVKTDSGTGTVNGDSIEWTTINEIVAEFEESLHQFGQDLKVNLELAKEIEDKVKTGSK